MRGCERCERGNGGGRWLDVGFHLVLLMSQKGEKRECIPQK
jgi:hypothetical protein